MIPIQQKITVQGALGERMSYTISSSFGAAKPLNIAGSAKGWRALLKEAWRHTGRYWHRFILPKHFQPQAVYEYQYAERTIAYRRRKTRKFGHNRPLVFTGRMERDVRRILDVRVSSKAARVVLHGPRYLYMKGGKRGTGPNMAAELAAISERDAKALATVMDRFVGRKTARGRILNAAAGHALGAAAA